MTRLEKREDVDDAQLPHSNGYFEFFGVAAMPSTVILLPRRYPRSRGATIVHSAPPCAALPCRPFFSGSPKLALRSIASIAGVKGRSLLSRSNMGSPWTLRSQDGAQRRRLALLCARDKLGAEVAKTHLRHMSLPAPSHQVQKTAVIGRNPHTQIECYGGGTIAVIRLPVSTPIRFSAYRSPRANCHHVIATVFQARCVSPSPP